MTAPDGSPPPRRVAVLVSAVVLVLLAWPLVTPAIWARGEAREGLVVRDIVEQGRWMMPRRMGELPSKPPLFHWIAAGAAHVAGFSDVTVRLPSAVAAAAMAGTTFVAGWLVGGPATAWLGVAVLLGILEFWSSASEARVDMVFAACITAALTGFFAWYRATLVGRPAARARALSYLATAAAVLAKGPAGAVLPALVIAGFLLVERRAALLWRFWSWPLVAAVVLVDGGWYAYATLEGGRDFVALQLLHENVDRFVGQGGFQRSTDPLSFRHFVLRMEVELVKEFFPWNLALVAAAVRWWRGQPETAGGRFLHAWWITVLVVFTVAAGKRTVYLLPLAPAIALLAAFAFARRLGPAGTLTRPTLALVAVLACADVAALLGNQALRRHQAGRHSLLPVAGELRRLVPTSCALEATGGVAETDRLVLAYRLGRDIGRVRSATARGDLLLAPTDRTETLAGDGFVLLARLPGDRLALVGRPDARACTLVALGNR